MSEQVSSIPSSVSTPPTRRRRWGIGLLLAVAFPLAWFLFWPAPDPGQILAVECEYFPGYSYSYHWEIKLNATGQGTYSLDGYRYKKQSGPISVPIAELQQAIRENALATLPSRLGHMVPDSSSHRLHIKTTRLDKTIKYEWEDSRELSFYHTRAYSILSIVDNWIKPHAVRRQITPVKGRLLINGQPAKSRIRITAREPDAPPEDTGKHAFTDANGNFQFTSVEKGDGIMSGTYDITILWGQTSMLRNTYLGPDRLGNRYDKDHPWKKGLIVDDDKPVDLGTIDLKADVPLDLKDNEADRFPEKTPSQ